MSRWEEVEFGDLSSFRNGLNFKHDSYGKGCQIIGVSDFGDRLIPDYQSLSEINTDGIVKDDDYLKKGDIVFVRSNGNKNLVGRSMFINESNRKLVYSGFCIRARINSERACPEFYAYFFRTTLFRQLISQAAGGANIQNLNQGMLSRAIVPLPPVQTQQKIASILSAYDDLIENNLKRIKLLEEIAQRTYEEWFVHRTISGTVISDDKFDVIPLEELVEDYMNGGWGKDNCEGSFTSEAYVIRGTDIPDILQGTLSSIPLRYHSEKNLAPRTLQYGDIVIEMSNGNINSVGRSYFFDSSISKYLRKPFMCASFCKMLRPKPAFATLIALHLKYIHATNNMLIYKSQGANGINNFQFENMLSEEELFIPKRKLLDAFTKKIERILTLASNLRLQNVYLKEARDILLPRLMSGEIDVEKMKENEPMIIKQ